MLLIRPILRFRDLKANLIVNAIGVVGVVKMSILATLAFTVANGIDLYWQALKQEKKILADCLVIVIISYFHSLSLSIERVLTFEG